MAAMHDPLTNHLVKYSPSLHCFKGHYLQLFFGINTIVPDHFGYICPLCLANGIFVLNDERVFDTSVKFTDDHFPPESVGGKATILVCETCNNGAGAKFEASLKKKIKDMAFQNKVPLATMSAKTKISDVIGNYPSLMTVKENGELEISFKPNSKGHVPFLDQWLDTSKSDFNWTADVTYFSADETKVSKSLLKAAYLYCFQYWGYDFAYSYTGKSIRDIIAGKADYPLKNPSFWLGEVAKKVEKIQLGLCYLKSPEDLKCFIVNMLLTDRETGYHNIASIIIPGPHATDWEKLAKIQLVLDNEPNMSLILAHVTDYSVMDKVFDGYTMSWNYLNKHEM